jgi:hypothetical protein
MVNHMDIAVAAANHLYRRGVAPPPEYEVPSWTPWVILFDIILFLPIWIFIAYTLHAVFPVLAIVEDENPPSYQSLATTAPVDGDDAESTAEAGPLPTKTDGSPRAVTSSLRLTQRLIRSQAGGPRGYLRGLPALVAYSVALSILNGIFSVALPGPLKVVGLLIGTLALVQLRTAWVHIVITQRSPLPFWRRLPPFRRTFEATAKPTALLWVAYIVGGAAPLLAIRFLNIQMPEDPQKIDPSLSWKGFIVFLTFLAQVFIIIPAEVILTRVQASLLPEDHETIIPFDRSFQGAVEPAVISGKGYVSIKDAWSTFSRQAWRRLVIMYIKITGVTIAAWMLLAVVVIPEVFLIIANSTEKKN